MKLPFPGFRERLQILEPEEIVADVEQPKPPAIKEQLRQSVTPPVERSTAVLPSTESDNTRYILTLALLAIGLTMIVYILRRRGKK